jgi:DNA-binding beta-propeller fold protein YncE
MRAITLGFSLLMTTLAGSRAIFAAPPAATPEPASIALPDAPADGVALDYLAVDHARNRVWIPAGGTGSVDVIDAKTRELHRVSGFATKEVERRGHKRLVGPSSATIGDGVVYVGSRADASVCAIDAASLEKAGCVTLPTPPDGVAFVARTKEVWVTTPSDQSIVILDVSSKTAPKIAGTIKLEGDPEGYAVDNARQVFYTNLEDKDRTLRIDLATRKVTATWMPACGEAGPRGLAIEPTGRWLMVACTDHVEVLDAAKDGAILSKLDTGGGVDNPYYLPEPRSLYAASGATATLVVAHLDAKGVLTKKGSYATSQGVRNVVATDDGTAYAGDGGGGRIVIVKPPRGR